MLLCIKNDCPLVNMDSVISLVKQQLVKTYIILCTPHNIHKVILMQVISFSIFHVPVCPIFLIAILYEWWCEYVGLRLIHDPCIMMSTSAKRAIPHSSCSGHWQTIHGTVSLHSYGFIVWCYFNPTMFV